MLPPFTYFITNYENFCSWILRILNDKRMNQDLQILKSYRCFKTTSSLSFLIINILITINQKCFITITGPYFELQEYIIIPRYRVDYIHHIIHYLYTLFI